MSDLLPTPDVLRAHAVRWVDADGWPWVVEVCFADAHGQVHSIVDKIPLFDFEDEEPGPETDFPVVVLLECTLLGMDPSGAYQRIGIAHRSLNDEGYAEFTVPAQAVRRAP